MTVEHKSKSKLELICHDMPKVELHCHLYGTIRKETLHFFNRRAGLPFAEDEIEAFYVRGDKPVGVLRVFRALDSILIKYSQDIYRLVQEYLEDARSHNVLYSEFFWNPTGCVLLSKIPYPDAQRAIADAISDMKKSHGIVAKCICAIDREAEPERAAEMLQMMIENPHPDFIGVGIDYRETDRPPQLFKETFEAARKSGLKLTAHAGEFGTSWTNVDFVVNTIKTDRVDHGYTIVDNPKLLQQCVQEGKIFTVVPTNSYYLRTLKPEEWALKHPIRKMVASGLKVHPNTDDPTLHNVDPTKAWLMMAECFDCTIADLKSFCFNGIDAAWVDDETKATWKADWGPYFDPYL
ncbi:hypothetical protein CANARDRAFT_8614 [[Candida] arabinofermentans NRRL YB-2248]|uniref:Adenosine deaminase domain-containing protein n=1 Tax=[Candida] arabinofermentans NRRL YB-2248 TaxID=983967 RepID=A0A1E4SYS3_9ASCO|nr:hypothetical protein CANARDRAFT_8614 [[Candida] arabinofermentans NRRL YB-2248]